MWTRIFWRDAGERAIKSFAQGVLLVFAQDAQPFAELRLFDATFASTMGVGLSYALMSVLTSVASASATGTVSPASLARADQSNM